jgi:hypothetical protein
MLETATGNVSDGRCCYTGKAKDNFKNKGEKSSVEGKNKIHVSAL